MLYNDLVKKSAKKTLHAIAHKVLRLTTASLFLAQPIALAEDQTNFFFALIGDLPYGVKAGSSDAQTTALVAELNSDDSLSWVLHAGDIKTGGSSCSDKMFSDRAARFGELNKPFVLTPGDNEWTDCHRPTAGHFDPLERLEALRSLFYTSKSATETRARLNIKQQSDTHPAHSAFVENYFWEKNKVAFATIHISGSMNGRAEFSSLSKLSRRKKHDDEVEAREAAALDWLSYSFEQAKASKAVALFIMIHANPGLDPRWEKKLRPIYAFFNEALESEIKSFDGQVVLAHGDSHYVRIDKPKLHLGRPPANFLRVESFGENNQAWIKVEVDPSSPQVFSFTFFDRITETKND